MFCPVENARMHQAAVPSHYGQKLIIDQCEKCGGVWFDAFELYRVKQGEAQKIEELDSENLRAPSDINRAPLLCPRDQAELFQFDDPGFPKGIILTRCPTCQGYWLNRGEFTNYQEARQKMMLPKAKTPDDLKLEEQVERLLESHRSGGDGGAAGKLVKFLSAPLEKQALSPFESSQRFADDGNNLDTVLNILITILRLFIFR